MSVRNQAYLTLEKSLQRHLHASWERQARPVIQKILTQVESSQYASAQETLTLLDFRQVRDEVEPFSMFVGMTALLFGASTATPSAYAPDTSMFKEQKRFREYVSVAMDQLYVGFERLGRDLVLRKAARAISEAEVRTKKVADPVLAALLNKLVAGGGKGLLNVGANLTTSRLATLGYLAEAESRGHTEYQVSEILDEITCPVCVRMHGRVFRVQLAKLQVESILRERDPQALKGMSPFYPQTKEAIAALETMTDAEVQAAGYSIPPYHPSCRGIAVRVGNAEKLEFPAPETLQGLPPG